jgi:hypothetical protein
MAERLELKGGLRLCQGEPQERLSILMVAKHGESRELSFIRPLLRDERLIGNSALSYNLKLRLEFTLSLHK